MKQVLDMRVTGVSHPYVGYGLLRLCPSDGSCLKEIKPGQFVQVRVDHSPTTFLRRPISVHFVDDATGELLLLVREAGEGTRQLIHCKVGDSLNIILPLGNGFTPISSGRALLVGGGVGIAPLLELAKRLNHDGVEVVVLIGGRSRNHILCEDDLRRYATVMVATDDGSYGIKGLVTEHRAFNEHWDMIYCCGPMPMMKAVARLAHLSDTPCEVSLENRMACGIGACLCCVEKTKGDGNVCVCTDGPVFNIENLQWQ